MHQQEPGRDLAGFRHGHVFPGGSHDGHERRIRRVGALAVLMMVGRIVAGSIAAPTLAPVALAVGPAREAR